MQGERGSHGRSIMLCLLLSVVSNAHKAARLTLHIHRRTSPLRSLVELLGFEMCEESLAYEPLPSHDAWIADARPLRASLIRALAANQKLISGSKKLFELDADGMGFAKALEVIPR